MSGPLTFAMAKVSESWSARQQRHLSYISEFTMDIQYVAGKTNVVADCLSRAIAGAVHLGQELRTPTTGLQLSEVPIGDGGTTLLCDISTGQARPLVPASWRRWVFDVVHGLSHPGRKPSQRLVAAKFVWRGLKKDVRNWADSCVDCQRSKVHRHTKAPLAHFPVPERRFDHVNVDFVGPLPSSHDFTYLLTMVARTTRWPEAVPLTAATTLRWPEPSLGPGLPWIRLTECVSAFIAQ